MGKRKGPGWLVGSERMLALKDDIEGGASPVMS